MSDKIPSTSFSRLNRGMKISHIFQAAKSLERSWGTDLHSDTMQHLVECLQIFSEQYSLQKKTSEVRDLHLGRLAKALHLDMTYHQFLAVFIPIERAFGKTVADHDFLVTSLDRSSSDQQEERASHRKPPRQERSNRQSTQSNGSLDNHQESKPPFELYVILDNIRSAFNVGSIFRTSECFGIQEMFLCGYTPTPKQPQTNATAMGTSDCVRWSWEKSTADVIIRMKKSGIHVIGLETTEHRKCISTCADHQKIAVVVGNEKHGISPEILSHCDEVREIALYGAKNSLNVGVAFGIIANHFLGTGRILNRSVDIQSIVKTP